MRDDFFMNPVHFVDGDASERDLLVDDIQRIREVLHIGAGDNTWSEEEDDEEEDSEEEEEVGQLQAKEDAFCGSIPGNLLHQGSVCLSSNINGRVSITDLSADGKDQEACSGKDDDSVKSSTEPVTSALQGTQHIEEHLSNTSDVEDSNNGFQHPSSESGDYTLTELQPVTFEPTSSFTSFSYGKQHDDSWQMDFQLNQIPQHSQSALEGCFPKNRDMTKDGNKTGEKENIKALLELNSDYQLAILDELDRIELALAKNKEKQLGLHQMRACRDDIKSEPHTLISFSNPYFRDKNFLGPPDNEDSKSKRKNCQVGGYELPSKNWSAREKEALAEGVRMQNLELKLSPALKKICKLEAKKSKSDRDLKELESLQAEKHRIRNLPKDHLERDLDGIDWDRLSGTYLQRRSGFECRLQWCNFGHPDVNVSPWTKEEDKILIRLAKSQDTWDIIAQKLQTRRTPIHCYQRYQRSLNKDLLKGKWTDEEDQRLLEVVRVVGEGNWSRVAGFMDGRMGDQCMHRYVQTLKPEKKGKWSTEEDELLKKAVSKLGPASWYKMADSVPGRTGSQCRERWVNALDPKIKKGGWSEEQDRRLLEIIEQYGRGNWAKIARAMGDRTDNQCWRRWIVLRKEDSLHYRRNILRKRRELVANFTGRKRERPSLQPEDLDIPDLPVDVHALRKTKRRKPLPPEECREQQESSGQKEKAKETQEKHADEIAMKKRTLRKRKAVKHYIDNSDSEEGQTLSEGDEWDGSSAAIDRNDDGNPPSDAEQEKKNSRSVMEVKKKDCRPEKVAANRNKVPSPQYLVLNKGKQHGKCTDVAEKRQKRLRSNPDHEEPEAEKKVAVSGPLAPFSLLLQAFSIDIPTVLQAIQGSSSKPTATPVLPSTGVTLAQGSSGAGEEKTVDSTSQQKQPENNVSGNSVSCSQDSSQGEGQGLPSSEGSTQKDKGVSTTSPGSKDQGGFLGSNGKERPDMKNDGGCIGENEANLNTGELVSRSSSQVSTETIKTSTLSPSTHEQERVSSRQTSTAAGKTPVKRAPVIPPLPPCCTTLKTFKSLQQLRPHLEQLAAMLRGSSAGSVAMAQSASCSISSSTGVGNKFYDVAGDSSVGSCEIARDRHMVSCETEAEGREEDAGSSSSELLKKKDSTECLESNDGKTQSVAGENPSSCSNTEESPDVSLSNNGEHGSVSTPSVLKRVSTPFNGAVTSERSETNLASQSTPTIVDHAVLQDRGKGEETRSLNQQLNSTRYRNTYSHKLLSSRFNSLFLWPALLSKISPHEEHHTNNYLSRIAPVFAERHPPPRCALYRNAGNLKSLNRKSSLQDGSTSCRRKKPGLAAVRMASSASTGTIAQQMITVGQGSAVRQSAPASTISRAGSNEIFAPVDSSESRDCAARPRAKRVNSDSNAGQRPSLPKNGLNSNVRNKKAATPKTRSSNRIVMRNSIGTRESGKRKQSFIGSLQHPSLTSSPVSRGLSDFHGSQPCLQPEHEQCSATSAQGAETADTSLSASVDQTSSTTDVGSSPGSVKRKTSAPRRNHNVEKEQGWQTCSTDDNEDS